MPKAFLIVELTVTDPAIYETYRSQVLPTLESVGARFVVRGGKRLQLEGVDEGHHNMLRTIIVEFPSMDIATAWYQSPSYAALKKLRMSCSVGRAFIVEGA
jgi:uncharacterized protein (DUF1330 family)